MSRFGGDVGLHENPDLTPGAPATGGRRGAPTADGRPPGMPSDLDLETVRGIMVNTEIADDIEGLLAEADGIALTG